MDGTKGKKRKEPSLPPFARLIASDELGLLKVAEVPAGPKWESTAVVQKWGQPDKSQNIVTMAASTSQQPTSTAPVVAIARQAGSIELLDSLNGTCLATIPVPPPSTSGGAAKSGAGSKCGISALGFLPQAEGSGLQLASCTSSGLVRLHQQAGSSSTSGGAAAGGSSWEVVKSFQACSSAECMAIDSAGTRAAVGGDGCNLSVWSLESGQEVFHAKGNKPNRVGLVDLPHLTSATFVPGTDSQTVLVGTAKHKLWMYDMRAGKRPQLEVDWMQARVTALAAEYDGGRVWAANGTGHIEALDFKAGKMQGSLKGAGGSVRALQLHPDPQQPLIASVGLDRFMRVHSTRSRQQLCKVYLKQQQTGVAWLPGGAPAVAEEEEEQAREREEEEGAAGQEDDGVEKQAEEGKKQRSKAKSSADKSGKQKQKKQRKSAGDS